MKTKRMLSLLLVLVMCVNSFGTIVLAAGDAPSGKFTFAESVDGLTVSDMDRSFQFTFDFDETVTHWMTFNLTVTGGIGDVTITGSSSSDGDGTVYMVRNNNTTKDVTWSTSEVQGTFAANPGSTNTNTMKEIDGFKLNIPANAYGDFVVTLAVSEWGYYTNYQTSTTDTDNKTFYVEKGATPLTYTTTVSVAGDGEPSTPAGGYTASLATADGHDLKVGDEIDVNVQVNNAFASSQLTLTYTGLEYVSATANGADVADSVGTLSIIDHGATQEAGTAYTLRFRVKEILPSPTGTAAVTLTGAAFSTQEDAAAKDLDDATITDEELSFTVTPADLKVELDSDFNGAESVVYGQDYTFEADDKNYVYEIKVEGGTAIDNEDGSWTVENVASDLKITYTSKTAKKFDVTINTTDHLADPHPATGADAATYKEDYTFTLKANEYVLGDTGKQYSVGSIMINGVDVKDSCTVNDKTYTIPGNLITADITINTIVSDLAPNAFEITVNKGEGVTMTVAPDNQVASGGNITLTLTPVAGYKYTVTYTMGGSEPQTVTFSDNVGTIANVTGNVSITASREVDTGAITVTANQYLALDGQTMYLVTASGTLADGYAYTYGGKAMYKLGDQYVYLVISSSTVTNDTAKSNVSIAQTAAAGTIARTGEVNGTDALDANDAQLVWNMYQGMAYTDFTIGMEKFLRADVNSDGKIDVDDAAWIVNKIKNPN